MDRATFFGMLKGRLTDQELKIVQIAYCIAKNMHRTQVRELDDTRYFEHVRAVAVILIERGYYDFRTLVLALLHDIFEDTYIADGMILAFLGPEIYKGLQALSEVTPSYDPLTGFITFGPKKSKEEYYAGIQSAGWRVVLVKFADRYHNLQTFFGFDPERRQRKIEETERYMLPILRKQNLAFAKEIEEQLVALKAA